MLEKNIQLKVIVHVNSSEMSNWEKFNYNNWDEPGYIYCDKCGVKNRSDAGWYRRERVYNAQYEALKMQAMMLVCNMPPIQNKEYRCSACWKTEKDKRSNQRRCSKCKTQGHTKRTCPNT